MSEETYLDKLTDAQYQELKDALPLITVLIAGADGDIDSSELNWAEKLTHIRSYATPEMLNSYYTDVEQTFHEALEKLIAELPGSVEARQEIITHRLEKINKILPILTNKSAHTIYESFTSFAEHIAKSSGGFLRFGAVSAEEHQWIDLPMITPIILLEDE